MLLLIPGLVILGGADDVLRSGVLTSESTVCTADIEPRKYDDYAQS